MFYHSQLLRARFELVENKNLESIEVFYRSYCSNPVVITITLLHHAIAVIGNGG